MGGVRAYWQSISKVLRFIILAQNIFLGLDDCFSGKAFRQLRIREVFSDQYSLGRDLHILTN